MRERIKILWIGIIVWWILLFPFDYQLFNWFFKSIQYPFVQLLQASDRSLVFETDTLGTNLLVLVSMLLGALCSPIALWILKKTNTTSSQALKTVLASVLFFFLFSYGWNKVVKLQFYQPEPNTVYTPFGLLSKDIAYWSIVGSSYTYTVVLGYIELIAASLLLFKRTQFLASLLGISVFAQVVLVNFSFDISVKLLSVSLLVFSISYSFQFQNHWRSIFGYNVIQQQQLTSKKHRIIRYLFVLVVILEVCLPSLISGVFNDDNSSRIAHHGAYQVIGSKKVKRMFVHREKYLILQLMDERLTDYEINITDPRHYFSKNNEIQARWNERGDELIIAEDTFGLKKIPYQELPLLKKEFHWFGDLFH